MRLRRLLGYLATFVLLAGLVVTLVTAPPVGHNPLEVAGWIAGIISVYLVVIRPARRPRVATPTQVVEAQRMLATVQAVQWRREAAARNLSPDSSGLSVLWADRANPDRVGGVDDLVRTTVDGKSRRLFILGEAGSGKTSLVVLLTLAMLDEPARTVVPILLNASEWDPAGPLEEWVTAQLSTRFKAILDETTYGTDAAERLIVERLVLPILDGLDELPADRLQAAFDRLKNDSDQSFVVTCRTGSYERAGSPAPAGAAVVEVRPVGLEIAVDYLSTRGGWAAADKATVLDSQRTGRHSRGLASVLRTPLAIYLADVYVNQGHRSPLELVRLSADNGRADLENALFGSYVETVYTANIRTAKRKRATIEPAVVAPELWDPGKAQRWLGALATDLNRASASEWTWYGQQTPMRLAFGWRKKAVSDRIDSVLTSVLIVAAGLVALWPARAVPFTFDALPRQFGAPVAGPVLRWVYGWKPTDESIQRYLAAVRDLTAPVGGPYRAGPVVLALAAIGYLVFSNIHVIAPVELGSGSQRAIAGRDRRAAIVAMVGAVVLAVAAVLLIRYVVGVFVRQPFYVAPTGYETVIYSFVGRVLPFAPLVVAVPAVANFAWPEYLVMAWWRALRRRGPLRLMAFLDDAAKLGILRTSNGSFQFRHLRVQQALAPGAKPEDEESELDNPFDHAAQA